MMLPFFTVKFEGNADFLPKIRVLSKGNDY